MRLMRLQRIKEYLRKRGSMGRPKPKFSPGQLITFDKARPRKKQHTSPCSDCPFARKSLHGWLGRMSAEEWIEAVHGEALIDCHTISNQQCAGAAIYRANVCKSCRFDFQLKLASDKITVFASPFEFLLHHKNGTLITR